MATFIDTVLMRGLVAVAELRARLGSERGQDLLEYALLGGVIAVFVTGLGVALAATGAIDNMAGGIAECIDFDTVCP